MRAYDFVFDTTAEGHEPTCVARSRERPGPRLFESQPITFDDQCDRLELVLSCECPSFRHEPTPLSSSTLTRCP